MFDEEKLYDMINIYTCLKSNSEKVTYKNVCVY